MQIRIVGEDMMAESIRCLDRPAVKHKDTVFDLRLLHLLGEVRVQDLLDILLTGLKVCPVVVCQLVEETRIACRLGRQ